MSAKKQTATTPTNYEIVSDRVVGHVPGTVVPADALGQSLPVLIGSGAVKATKKKPTTTTQEK